jgi:hypothetical protein
MAMKRHVSELEGSFGFLSEQVKGVHKDPLAFETRTEQRFKKVDERFDRLESKIDGLDRKIDTKVDGLTKSMPGIVRDALSDYEVKPAGPFMSFGAWRAGPRPQRVLVTAYRPDPRQWSEDFMRRRK